MIIVSQKMRPHTKDLGDNTQYINETNNTYHGVSPGALAEADGGLVHEHAHLVSELAVAVRDERHVLRLEMWEVGERAENRSHYMSTTKPEQERTKNGYSDQPRKLLKVATRRLSALPWPSSSL